MLLASHSLSVRISISAFPWPIIKTLFSLKSFFNLGYLFVYVFIGWWVGYGRETIIALESCGMHIRQSTSCCNKNESKMSDLFLPKYLNKHVLFFSFEIIVQILP